LFLLWYVTPLTAPARATDNGYSAPGSPASC
jgi:hypothetical protein